MLENETKNRAGAASQPSDQQTTPVDDIAISVKNLTKTYRIFGLSGSSPKPVNAMATNEIIVRKSALRYSYNPFLLK